VKVKSGSIILNKATDKLPNSQKKIAPTRKETSEKTVQKNRKSVLNTVVKLRGPQLPSGTVTSGLRARAKMPNTERDINKNLKNKSPWYQSISDPLRGADAKIPDETGVETGTLQLVQKFTVSTNDFDSQATGICGFKITTPYVNNIQTSDGVTNSTIPGSNYKILSVNSTAHSLSWGSYNNTLVNQPHTEGVWGNSGVPFDSVSDLQAVTGDHRVVSACLMVQPEPALATNQGEFTLFSVPFDDEGSPEYEAYMNRYKSSTVPVNTNKAGMALWYPCAVDYRSFKEFFTTTATTIDTEKATTPGETVPPWVLGFVSNGCAPNVTFRVTVVVNYEFIPRYNSLNIIDSSPSPNDAVEVDLVENWVQDLPVTKIVPQSSVSRAPQTVEPQHGENDAGTGFGMFFNVISELAPLALALL